MDAWGGSWGECWGGSWGDVDSAVVGVGRAVRRDDDDSHERQRADRIRQQNDLILMTVIAAVTGGMLT